jgi:hypothetical protein
MKEEISEIWRESNDGNFRPVGATATYEYIESH